MGASTIQIWGVRHYRGSSGRSRSMVESSLQWGYNLLQERVQADWPGEESTQPCWRPSSKGQFTTKSIYDLLNQVSGVDMSFNWEVLWRFKGSVRGSLLLWMVAHDRLKTTSLLWEKQYLEFSACAICDDPMKISLHAVRDYWPPYQVWHHMVSRSFWSIFWKTLNLKEWIANNIKEKLPDWSESSH